MTYKQLVLSVFDRVSKALDGAEKGTADYLYLVAQYTVLEGIIEAASDGDDGDGE